MASLTPKYLRAHHVNVDSTPTQALVWFMKLVYEFWGFCYHTPDSLTVPNGFPVGGVDMPAGFESGSLLRTGSSGYTYVGENYFRDDSADFLSGSSLKNKYIVTWKSGSTSNDDGIYKIRRVFDSGTLVVDTNMGATPYSGTLEPLFDVRNNINYRIVDFEDTATNITMTSGSGLVLELSGASLINSGQLDPQFRIKFTENSGDNIQLSFSPSGSWNGTDFSGNEKVCVDRDWANGSTGQGHISLICADDFMIAHWKGQWNDASSGFHIEIPSRLYPRQNDPNPIVASNWGANTIGTNSSNTAYGDTAFMMHTPFTDTIDVWRPLALSPIGISYDEDLTNSVERFAGVIPGRRSGIGHNPVTDKFYATDAVLSFIDSSEFYSLARVRMRRFRLTSDVPPDFSRLGVNGEWIKLNDGIMWPWDNAILPDELLPDGQ